ncbi:ATP-binding cassette domain-containing protein [Sphingomonas qilianensis]|uniref:ATP-binding cassette domain-containing protein n=1 Tax=Sphingomonas qilianensis TaxID=1736690 RepID=A0ABU9XPQ7_9SPHN
MSFDVDIHGNVGATEIRCRIEPVDGLTVLFGPSGAGKTSVLNMIAGLIDPGAGHIRVAGRTLFDESWDPWDFNSMPPERRRAGYVFQDSRLFPHMKVVANLRYAAPDRPLDLAPIAFLGIDHLLDRWPRSLSGGEARRVAIGRALLSDPAFLLLDEPLSSLDAPRREEITRAIEHLRDVVRLPILMVTHDAAEAERLGTRIVAMGD